MTLDQSIKQLANLTRPNSLGWYPTLCKICHDHGRKGPRAAFKFDNGSIAYHCFNCNHTASYNPARNRTMPRKMVEVFDAFGIDSSLWRAEVFANFGKQHSERASNSTPVELDPPSIALPAHSAPLTDNDDDVSQYAIEYLTTRGINWKDYPFYLTTADNPMWFGRLIIPIYKDDKLIFYQGRDLTGLQSRKYLNPRTQHNNVLYGFDQLHADTNDPLYVVEGWFDAFLIDGVAVFGNQLSEAQIMWLNTSPRKKIIIPDREGNGAPLALQGIELGWSVSIPDAPSCKDVSDVVNKYGLLYTLKTIADNTKTGFAAKAAVAINCK